MFYSHTILARKSPLGTVWIAAHLEGKIRKPQIDAIDIPSYAECIMFPEVPIALRLSAHLLLGLVRIYSWKVNYLFKDCNKVVVDVRVYSASTKVNLPPEETHAPFESITVPETFNLDAFELDDVIEPLDAQDKHSKTLDQITLDNFDDHYVAVVIDEDDRTTTSSPSVLRRGTQPTASHPANNEDVPGSLLENAETVISKSNSSLVQELDGEQIISEALKNFEPQNIPELNNATTVADEVPEVEAMRADFEILAPQTLRDLDDIISDMNVDIQGSLEKNDNSISTVKNVQSCDREALPASVFQEARDLLNDSGGLNMSLSAGGPMPEFDLRPSPAVEKKVKKRKRKQIYDETLVLSNGEMKKQLEDASKLVSKRRKLPSSALDAWRLRTSLKKDSIFEQSYPESACSSFQEIFQRQYPRETGKPTSRKASSGSACVPPDEPSVEAQVGPALLRDSPRNTSDLSRCTIPNEIELEAPRVTTPTVADLPDFTAEVEYPRFEANAEAGFPDMRSPLTREDLTSLKGSNISSEPDARRTFDTEVLPSLRSDLSSRQIQTDIGTPLFRLDEEDDQFSRDVPEIPALAKSAEREDLVFLEGSDDSPASDSGDIGTMSARTKAVAQFFKDQAPSTPTLEGNPGNFSLLKILEGKSRRQAARMFFETLVLKTYDLIHVQQEAAYGDIRISVTSELSKI